MSATRPATVVTEGGRVVGVQIDPPPQAGAEGPSAWLVAGPGQAMHRLDLRDLVLPERDADVERFHRAVEQRLARAAGGG